MELVRRIWAHLFGYQRDQEMSALSGSKSYGDVSNVKFIHNHDGDTITVNIEGFPSLVGDAVPVRVAGIDTPEMTDPRPKIKELALQARALTASKLTSAKQIDLKNIRRDKYFRILAEVWIDDQKLSDSLMAAGLAKEYDGGTKSPW